MKTLATLENVMHKIGLLLVKASELGMDCSQYGFADENQNSGYTYLWFKDYFTLYIGLHNGTIYSLSTDSNDGNEIEIDISDMSLYDIDEWVEIRLRVNSTKIPKERMDF